MTISKQDFDSYYYWMISDGYTKWHVSDLIQQQNEKNLIIKNSFVENGQFVNKDNIHETIAYWYQKILDLKPKTLFDVGFGCGNNLINLHKLLPDIEINGIELSRKQCDAGDKLFKLYEYNFNLWEGNFLNFSIDKKFELVTSMTVLMHIPSHIIKQFLRKMLELSSKYVILSDWYFSIPVEELEEIISEYGKFERVLTKPLEAIKNDECVKHMFFVERQ